MVSGQRALLFPFGSFPIVDAPHLQVIQLVTEMVHYTFPHSPLPHLFLGDRKQVFLRNIFKGAHLFAAVFASPL